MVPKAASLEAKPYPTLDAIRDVFALALKRDREINNFNPLVLWDLQYLREIDDSIYINRPYGRVREIQMVCKRMKLLPRVPRWYNAGTVPLHTLSE
jgi:hypothetical protein